MTIEDIILSGDTRGVSRLRRRLPADFCQSAAQYVLDSEGTVLILTGFYVKGSWETDGPPGAVAIGRALEALGRKVIYITDGAAPMLRGLVGRPKDKVREFPITGREASKIAARSILTAVKPGLAISIERCGMTKESKLYLNMRGIDISEHTAKLDYLFQGVKKNVAIGDGGNEIGMGSVYEHIPAVSTLVPDPAVTPADHLIIASVSNWGGYGLVACLSILTGKDLLPSTEEEFKMVKKWIDLGGVDGISGEKVYTVDNMDAGQTANILSRLHQEVAASREAA